jgi:hypothetical protein
VSSVTKASKLVRDAGAALRQGALSSVPGAERPSLYDILQRLVEGRRLAVEASNAVWTACGLLERESGRQRSERESKRRARLEQRRRLAASGDAAREGAESPTSAARRREETASRRTALEALLTRTLEERIERSAVRGEERRNALTDFVMDMAVAESGETLEGRRFHSMFAKGALLAGLRRVGTK